jgi:hypothetical protein
MAGVWTKDIRGVETNIKARTIAADYLATCHCPHLCPGFTSVGVVQLIGDAPMEVEQSEHSNTCHCPHLCPDFTSVGVVHLIGDAPMEVEQSEHSNKWRVFVVGIMTTIKGSYGKN